MNISLDDAAEFLRRANRILILSHQFPDGDTLGSAAALCFALQRMGKQAATLCADRLSPKYAFLFEDMERPDFVPETIVSVDVADEELLGDALRPVYTGRVDLCIDHHATHKDFARLSYVDSGAAATTEIIYAIITRLGVGIDQKIAAAIYTGITTDTGGFRYANVTPRTHRIAACMMETGINTADIDRRMFETKTHARLEIERMALDSLQYYHEDRCAVISITRAMIDASGAREEDLDGLASLPRQVEGVLAGVTIREKKNGDFKISLRTESPLSAAAVCAKFGGGGHKNAAGCTMHGPLEDVREKVIKEVSRRLPGKAEPGCTARVEAGQK